MISGGMFRPDKPLKRYPIRFDDVLKPDAGNVWVHLRSYKVKLFLELTENLLKVYGYWAYVADFATMIPIVKRAKNAISIDEYLYYHERITMNTPQLRSRKDNEIEYLIQLNSVDV